MLLAKSHLRAFYLAPEPLTLKLVEPCARDALAREVAVRSALAVPCAPRLVAQRLDGPHPHLCEQLLFGRHPDPARDGERVVSFVLDELWQSYRASGFEWRRCAESHDLAALLANFDAMAAAASRRSPWPGPPALRGALERLGSEADRLVPWCLGHGDLSLGNLLLCEGRVRALDWERARRLPLLHELAKISVTVPGSWGPIVARIGQEFPNVPAPGMASPAAQGALAALERLAELRTRFDATSPDAVASPREAVRFRRRLKAELGHLARLMLPETA